MLNDLTLLSILAQSTNATAIYDSPELHISFVNDAMLQIWGKERDVIGKMMEQAIPEIEDQPFVGLLKNVWHTGETYIAVDTPATLEKNGVLHTSWFDFEYRAIRNESGEIIAILHTARDVSVRLLAGRQLAEKQQREDQLIAELGQTGKDMKAANENLTDANLKLRHSNDDINRLNARLQESETDFKRLVEQAPVAILVFRGPQMIISMANQAMLEILDKDTSIIGKPLLEGLPEIKGAPAVDMLFEVYNTAKELDGIEAPVPIKRNGQVDTRYFNFSYRPLIEQGKVIGVMDVAVEVTEQVLARKRLEANEQRLQRILDTMAEGVVIVKEDGTPGYANPMAQRIMGLTEDQFRDRVYNDSKWFNERVDGTPLPREDHPMHVVMRTGLPVYDQEIGIVRPSHEKIYISVNAAPLLDEEQVVTGAIVSFTDVTNRRRIMQQKDDFISVASHELKTPVTALKASLQLLEKITEQMEGEMTRRLVVQANRSLNKLSDLINSLLNVNRISQGRFPIHKKSFRMLDLINDCCQHIRTAGDHQVILKGDLDAEIVADEQLLDQVIVNMVNNAVKYAPQSREIVIEVQKNTDSICVSVTDFGPGIPEEKTRHIFERYYQVEGGSRQFSGLGLGLYISAEIIEKHGGKIGVNSNVGKGSIFWFTLPLA